MEFPVRNSRGTDEDFRQDVDNPVHVHGSAPPAGTGRVPTCGQMVTKCVVTNDARSQALSAGNSRVRMQQLSRSMHAHAMKRDGEGKERKVPMQPTGRARCERGRATSQAAYFLMNFRARRAMRGTNFGRSSRES